jgi:nicotinate phosphoribosyltransferase
MPTAISTDLYELTMIAAHLAARNEASATFELFVRHLPESRAYLVAAGLEQALEFLETVSFAERDIAYLRTVPALQGAPPEFFDDFLPRFRFTGDVWAMPEGTPVFAQEPIVRVTAPLVQAQLVETALLAIIPFQTSIASKAARVIEAAQGRPVVEFGARRAHGSQAALYSARAAFLAGCEGTSNVEAGARFGVPLSGTMAHSWILSFPDEIDAFRSFMSLYGDRAVLLLDTYDTRAAVRKIADAGLHPAAVRLDSGNLLELSHEVRAVLDRAGLGSTRILATGDLDEFRIAALVDADAPIDGFGVGAALATVPDAPSLGGVYKLVEFEQDSGKTPVMKRTPDKQTYPGRKQVWRVYDDGVAARDVVGLEHESAPGGGKPLLGRVMRNGARETASSLPDIRAACRKSVLELPRVCRLIRDPAAYTVERSEGLRTLIKQLA